jgi:hypothetical protein
LRLRRENLAHQLLDAIANDDDDDEEDLAPFRVVAYYTMYVIGRFYRESSDEMRTKLNEAQLKRNPSGP